MQLVMKRLQPPPQGLTYLCVKRAERLIEEKHVRLDGEGARERNPLALAAGKLIGIAVGKAIDLHEFEELADALFDFFLRLALLARAHPKPEGHILENGHVAEEGVMLENETDMALFHVEMRRADAVELHVAGIRELQARYDAQERGFP